MNARLTELNSLLDIKSDEVYYYTQTKTFLEKIIQPATPNKLSIYFSHYKNLEDSQEFIMGDKIIRKYKIEKSIPLSIESGKERTAPFQLSMSSSKDYYPMWKIYGKNDPCSNLANSNGPGIMLAFDKQKLLDNLQTDSPFAKILPCLYEGSIKYKRVVSYMRKEVKESTDGLVGYDTQILMAVFPSIAKGKQYSYEKEVRIVNILTSSRVSKQNSEPKTEEVRSGKIFRPMEIDISTLNEIMVGPCCEETFKEIKNKLLTISRVIGIRITDDKITHSQIPVRE